MKLVKRFATLMLACLVAVQCFPTMAHADNAELTGKTPAEITAMMGKGWNLGNTFDATGGNISDPLSQETSWGNPVVTKELIDGVKAAGFTTIRIPVTWGNYCSKDGSYTIDAAYMARVKEVVTWAYEDGLFVIINVHHESWVNRSDIDTAYPEIGKQLKAVWAQIANEFADYDQHLIFEGMNEPRAVNTDYEWTGTAACYEAVNYLTQVFVETVRANTNGYNGERMLMVPGYAASSSAAALRAIKLPELNGATAENLILSVHCYTPYDFCLSDNKTSFDPKKSADTSELVSFFSTLKSTFLDNGIQVVIGECGATNSNDNLESRRLWFGYFGSMCNKYGIPAVVWDNGAAGKTGGECHQYFVRKTGEAIYPELFEAFITGEYEKQVVAEDLFIDFEPVSNGDETVILTPYELGFHTNKLSKQMKVNHTPDASQGFAMKVDSSSDREAKFDVTRYAGMKIRVTAYISSQKGDTVAVLTEDSQSVEVATVEATEDWTEVKFDYEVPASGDAFVTFRGTEATYFVDDFSIEMNPQGELTPASDEAPVTEDTVEAVPDELAEQEIVPEKNSILPTIFIGLGVVAVAAIIVIILGSKKKK